MAEVTATSNIYALLLDDEMSRVLMLPGESDDWALPHIHIPDQKVWIPTVDLPCKALSRLLSAEITVLRVVDAHYPDDRRHADLIYAVENQTSDWVLPARARWIDRDALAHLPLTQPEHRSIIDEVLREAETRQIPHLRPPWACPGWFKAASTWMTDQLADQRYVLTGTIGQLKSWGISCLLQAETDRGTLFFKVATALPLFGNEPALLNALSERFPDYVPAPLAVEPAQRWMLMRDFGRELRAAPTLDRYERAVQRFGQLQVEAAAAVDNLLAVGCLDRRLEILASQIDPLLVDDAVIALLTTDDIARLRALAPRLKAMCAELAAYAVPYSLTHGDLHSGNITGETLRFFDWTDACIGHPFLDLCTVMAEVDDDFPDGRERVLDAYLNQWRAFEPPERLRQMWQLAEPLGALHQAVSYQHIVATLEPASKQELMWGVPEWLGRVLKTMPEAHE